MAFVPDASLSAPFAACGKPPDQADDEMDYLNTLLELEPLQEYCASVAPNCPRADMPATCQGGYSVHQPGEVPGSDSASGWQASMDQIYTAFEPAASRYAKDYFIAEKHRQTRLPPVGTGSAASSGAGYEDATSQQPHSQTYSAPYVGADGEIPIPRYPSRYAAPYICPLETQVKPPGIAPTKRKRPNADLYSHVLRKSVETPCKKQKHGSEVNSGQEQTLPENNDLPPSQRRERNPGPNGKIYRQAKTARFALRASQAFVAQRAQQQTNDSTGRTLPSVNAAVKAMERREREFDAADEEMETTRGDAVALAKWAGWANYALEADEACLTLAK